MRHRGIPIAQIDSATEADPKLLRLWKSLEPEEYLAVFGAYMSLVLRAWGRAERSPDPDHIEWIPEDLLARLTKARLIEADGSIPEAVFARWVGSVLEARRKDADRKRVDMSMKGPGSRGDRPDPTPPGGSPIGDPSESVGVQRSRMESIESSSPLLSSGGMDTTETENGKGGPGGNGFDPAEWAWLMGLAEEITGRTYALGSPYGGFGERARDSLARFGRRRVENAWKQVAGMHGGRPTIRQLLFEAEDILAPILAAPRARPLSPEEESDRRIQQRLAAAEAKRSQG